MLSGQSEKSFFLKLIAVFVLFVFSQIIVPDPILYHFSMSSDFSLPQEEPSQVWTFSKNMVLKTASYISENVVVKGIKTFDFNLINEKAQQSTSTYKIVSVKSQVTGPAESISWPIRGKLSSKFGMRYHPVTKKRSFHAGIDITSRKGTPVAAPVSGRITSAGYAGLMGKTVRIKTTTGMELFFGHLSMIKCKIGQQINKGQTIGLVGSSGRATGPHLHFAIKARGKYVDPLKFLAN